MFKKMVLAGVGLICGSLALDMRRQKLVKEIVGYGRSEANLKIAKKKGIIDSYFLRDDDFPGGVDFLMIGTPVETIVPLDQGFLAQARSGMHRQRRRQRQRRDRPWNGKSAAEGDLFRRRPSDRRQRAMGRPSGAGKSCSCAIARC